MKIAAKHGLTLTEADFEKEKRELSEDEMEAVAGGYACKFLFCDSGGMCDDW